MRWILILALTQVGCPQPDPVDTDPDTETLPDTDEPEVIQWIDRTIETSSTLNGVYSGGQGAFIVGDGGKAWRVSGGRAEPATTGVEARLMGIDGDGDGATADVTVAGYAGTVLVWNGEGYDKVASEALGTANFEDVDGDPDDLTAVSATGVFRYKDAAWAFESNAFNLSLRAVHTLSSGEAFAVGELGTVLRRVDGTWTEINNNSRKDLVDVHGAGSVVWMVGARGTVLRYSNNTLEEMEPPTNVNLQGVWVASSGSAYVVGNNGAAYKWDPTLPPDDDDTDTAPGGWVKLATGAQSNLYAVYGSAEDNIWAVGNRGAVYRYTGPKE